MGWEPCTIKDIKSYKPARNSIGSGQVLHCPYTYKKTRLIIKEMADILSLDLVAKKLVTNQLIVTVGYDIDNLINPILRDKYKGEITTDHYGRSIPKHSHGTINLDHYTSSSKVIMEKMLELYERIVNKDLLIRRINIVANNVIDEKKANDTPKFEQFDLFTNYQEQEEKRKKQKQEEQEENKLQNVLLTIKSKYGKNAILKGMNLEEGGTTIDRNGQIGGHKE